jgi:hypothetical protein
MLTVQEQRPVDMRIKGWRQLLVVALGLVGLGSGGAAVFITQLEAGPVALLAVGLVLFLVGLGGRLPSRLKMGENEISWPAIRGMQDFAVRYVEDAPQHESAEVADALGDLAEVAPQIAAPALGALAFLNLVYALLSDVLTQLNRDLPGPVYRYEPGGALGCDGVIVAPSGTEIAVEIKASAKAVAAMTLMRPRFNLETGRVSGILLITHDPLPALADQLLASLPGPALSVVVRGQEDEQLLSAAVVQVLYLAEASARPAAPPTPAK